jgi:hypothetical protein
MQYGIWTKAGAEQPCFPFTGKPSLNIDLEHPSNPLEYFKLSCMPEIVEVIARGTNQYAQQLSENKTNIKLNPGPFTGKR